MDVCDPSGLLPTKDCPSIVSEVFLNGNEPVQLDNLYQSFAINRETGYLATVFTPPQLIENKVFMMIPPEAQAWAKTANMPIAPTAYDAIQPSQINPDVNITAPALFAEVNGQVQIKGTAAGADFDRYRVLVGQGIDPQNWIQVGSDSTTPINDNVLATWDTTGLTGLYAVQLQVVRTRPACGYCNDPSDDKIIPCPRSQINSNRSASRSAHAKFLRRNRMSAFQSNSVISGAFMSTSLGETFIHEERFTADYHHGLAPIKLQAPLNIMSAWAADARLRDLPIESFAFLDTETSGLSGGTGTYAFLVGVGKFINDEFVLQQFFMRDPSEEPALLEGLGEFLASAKALVTFNGKAFDAPLLVTRYTLHGIPVPFKDFAHLDLLPLGKKVMARPAGITRLEISRGKHSVCATYGGRGAGL